MAKVMLEVDRITVRRGMDVVFTDCTLGLQSGQSAALVGPNGSGKSTLLEACAGLLTIEQGEIRHGAAPVVRPDGARRASPLLHGLTLQRNGAMGSETVEEHLRTAMSSVGRHTDLQPWLERFNLDHRRHDLIAHLSEGQARKVAVLAGLLPAFVAPSPGLVLLDEPTTGLDAKARAQTLAWMGDLCQRGHALLVSSHLDEVVDACSHTFDLASLQLKEAAPRAVEPATTPTSMSVPTEPVAKESGTQFGRRQHFRTQAWLSTNGVAALLTLGVLLVLGDIGARISGSQTLALVLAPAAAAGLVGEAMASLGREERCEDWRLALGLGTAHGTPMIAALGAGFTALAGIALTGSVDIVWVTAGAGLSAVVVWAMGVLQRSVRRLARPQAVFVGLFTPVLLLPYALLVDWLAR